MALFPTSYISTVAAAVTRNLDSLSLPFTGIPEALSVYVRFLELGTALTGAVDGPRVFAIGNIPQFWVEAVSGNYEVVHHNGINQITAVLAAAPAYGNLVELLAVLSANGSVTISQSINGGAIVTAGPSGSLTFAQAWGSSLIYVNNQASGFPGWIALSHLCVLRGVQTFAAMRRLAGVA